MLFSMKSQRINQDINFTSNYSVHNILPNKITSLLYTNANNCNIIYLIVSFLPLCK